MNANKPFLITPVLRRNVAGIVLLFAFSQLLVVSCQKHEGNSVNVKSSNQNGIGPDAAANRLDASRDANDIRTSLLLIRDQPTTPANAESQLRAVKLLGENRCVQAVPSLLSKLVDIRALQGRHLNFDQQYPIVPALAQIGEPGVPQITERFESTSDGLVQLLLLRSLIKIKGKRWVINYLFSLDAESKGGNKEHLAKWGEWVEKVE